jgi:hypothetical protein
MISSEVQRTLVKSPPELWAELSDPAALARHLGELGEIRIVRTEPEKTVEWAAEHTTGTVSIQPSGWGTKVTLSVTRELAEAERAAESAEAKDEDAESSESAHPVEAEPELADKTHAGDVPHASVQSEPMAEAEPEPQAAPESQAAPEPTAETEPEAEPTADAEPAPEPRRGFFARLFGRRRREVAAAPDAFAAVREVLTAESFAAVHPFATQPTTVNPTAEPTQAPAVEQETSAAPAQDIAAELMAAEEVAAEEVTAVLAAVLDRLGAAHHRPFSRA